MEEFFDRLNRAHKNYARYVYMLLLIAAVIVLFRILPYLFALLSPFVIAWFISLIASPLARMGKQKLHIPYHVSAVITVLLVLSILTLVIIVLVSAISSGWGLLAENWEEIYHTATKYGALLAERVVAFSEKLPFDMPEFFRDYLKEAQREANAEVPSLLGGQLMQSLSEWLRPVAGNVASGTITVVRSIPEVLVYAIMLILATYFFVSGKETFSRFYKKKTSVRLQQKLYMIRKECFGALFGWIRAQFILSGITALLLFVGFLILGVKSAWLLALITALVDLLPVLGTGSVLLPWALISLFAGGTLSFSVGLVALYFICLAARNILQPRILSDNIGLSPLAMLIAIWIGYKLYGFIGMIIIPVFAMLLFKLYDVGVFDWFFLSHAASSDKRPGGKTGKEETV